MVGPDLCHPRSTICQPQLPSCALGMYFVISCCISCCCCPLSLITLRVLKKNSGGTKPVNTCWNTQEKEYRFWLGGHACKKTTCLPKDVLTEKVSNSYFLVVECDIASTCITSGNILKNFSSGLNSNAMATKIFVWLGTCWLS